jgi:hypothetical protein
LVTAGLARAVFAAADLAADGLAAADDDFFAEAVADLLAAGAAALERADAFDWLAFLAGAVALDALAFAVDFFFWAMRVVSLSRITSNRS